MNDIITNELVEVIMLVLLMCGGTAFVYLMFRGAIYIAERITKKS